jgi:hypothetical protein
LIEFKNKKLVTNIDFKIKFILKLQTSKIEIIKISLLNYTTKFSWLKKLTDKVSFTSR